jgi:hypothetical protein
MWPKTPELHTLLKLCGGFCLSHFVIILDIAPRKLNEQGWIVFKEQVILVQLETLKTLEADLGWYIKKFDYINADKPWGNSKDALQRAINTVAGHNRK